MAHIWCLTFVEQSVVGAPWPASRHLPSHALMIPIPQGSKMEKIIDQGKHREITYHHGQNSASNCQLKWIWIVRNETKKIRTALSPCRFPGLVSLPCLPSILVPS